MLGSVRYPVPIAAFAILLGLWLFNSMTGRGVVERLVVVEAGFYKARATGKNLDAPQTSAGVGSAVADLELLKPAPEKSAVLGTKFGARFRVIGHPANASVKLRSVWKIPVPGITNKNNRMVHRDESSEFTAKIGEVGYRGFGFVQPWEIVPGVWTLEIRNGDRKLLEQSFTIK